MGDEVLDSILSSKSDALFIERPALLKLAYRGYVFEIRTEDIKAILRRLVREFEKEKPVEELVRAIDDNDLCEINLEESPLFKLSLGTRFFVNAVYYNEKQGRVVISGKALMECAEGQSKKNFRYYGYNFKPRELMADWLAHELRHWLQSKTTNVRYVSKSSALKYLILDKISKLFDYLFGTRNGIALLGLIFNMSVLALGLMIPNISLVCLLAIIISFAFISTLVNTNKFTKLKRTLDLFIDKMDHILRPIEIDAQKFGSFAAKDEEWLSLFKVTKIK